MNDDALIPEDEVVRAEVRGAISKRDVIDKELGPGKVYQGVGKTVRVLTATGAYSDREAQIDPEEKAGLIALARATARTVDKMTGHNATGWHANGRDLAPLVEQLRQTLEVLGGTIEEEDPLTKWLADESAPQEVTR